MNKQIVSQEAWELLNSAFQLAIAEAECGGARELALDLAQIKLNINRMLSERSSHARLLEGIATVLER